jgi:UMF1 family MFS transporter
LTAPVVAQRLDVTGRKLAGVRVTSILMFIFYLSTALVVLFMPSQALLATVFFTLALYFYIMSFVYYVPMINDLSTDANRGWVSGLGMGANYIGQVFGLLVTLPFATGAIKLFDAPGRAQTLIPAIILFAIAALPLLLKYKETAVERVITKMSISGEYAKVFQTAKAVFSIRNLSLFFIAYFLFSDALLTFSNNFPIFLEKVFSASDSVKTYLTAGILTLSGVGSLIFGKMADKKGTKYTLSIILAFWIVFFPMLAFVPSFTVAVIICLIAGLFFGAAWGVSRAMVSELTPREIEARSFSFYTLAERFATFIGPIMWSVILVATAKSGSASYSYALVGMGALVIIGLVVVRKIKSARIFEH